jgi:hypothetical protein
MPCHARILYLFSDKFLRFQPSLYSSNVYVIFKKRTIAPRVNFYGFEDGPCDTCEPGGSRSICGDIDGVLS